VVSPTYSHTIFAASLQGVFVSKDQGNTWSVLVTELPNVEVDQLQISPNGNDLYAFTYGRSAWSTHVNGIGYGYHILQADDSPPLFFSRSVVNFNAFPVGATHTLPATVTNTSHDDVTINDVSMPVDNAFSLDRSGCPSGVVLHGGDSCTVQVTYTVRASIQSTNTLTFSDSFGTQQLAVKGSGITSIGVSTTGVDFGSRQINGATGAGPTIVATNFSVNTVHMTPVFITVGGGVQDGNAFSIASDTCSNHDLAPNQTCAINVSFRPTMTGNILARAIFNNNSPDTPPYVVLSGTGLDTNAPVITASPSTLDFGNVATVQYVFQERVMTLTNTGGSDLLISSIAPSSYLSNNDALAFNVAEDFCSGVTLHPGQQCSLKVMFEPYQSTNTGTGQRTTPLYISSNAKTGGYTTFTLTGNGAAPSYTAPYTVFHGRPGGFKTDFGSQPVHGTAGCTMSVTFSPTAVGARTASVQFTDNAFDSPQTVLLTGVGVAMPVVNLSLAALTFSNTGLNKTSVAKDVLLTNSGLAPLSITGTTASSDFLQTNTCGTSVAAGATCKIHVTFTPTALGSRTSTLIVSDNAAGSPHTTALSGTGVPDYTLTSSSPRGAIVAEPNDTSYGAGAAVVLTAGPNPGYSFTGWSTDGTPVSATNPLTVTVDTNHAVTANFIAENPVPILNKTAPLSASVHGAAVTVTVTGTGFVSASTVDWDGLALPTTFVSSTQLTATIPATDFATATTARLTVVSPGPGGGTSNGLPFSVNAPPKIDSISPVSGVTTGGTTVTISGLGFLPGATVKFGASDATGVTVTQSATITCVAPTHAAGAVAITVTNPDGQNNTLANGYTYGAVNLTPPTRAAGPTVPITPLPHPSTRSPGPTVPAAAGTPAPLPVGR